MTNEINELIADVREQVLYLQELGVEAFDVSLSELSAKRFVELAGNRSEISNLRSEIANLRPEILKPVERPAAGSRLSGLPSLSKRSSAAPISVKGHQPEVGMSGEAKPENVADVPNVEKLLEDLSIPVAKNLEIPRVSNSVSIPGIIEQIPANIAEPTETIEQIRAEIGADCRRCKLCEGRTQVVNSAGNFNAELMFAGEAPGADEDEQGFPFVGRAGQLLTKIIESIGISREDVFIGNINRCRPPGNRAPEPDETIACKPFLQREIAVVRPKVVVVLGATAAQNLLETKVPIGKLRGQFHDYLGTKVMPTFHPAYLLRDPHKKREVWDDMKMVRDYLSSN